MSKGTQMISVRIQEDMRAEIEEMMLSAFDHGADTCTMADWIRGAVAERIAKIKRGRNGGRKGRNCCLCNKRIEGRNYVAVNRAAGQTEALCLPCHEDCQKAGA